MKLHNRPQVALTTLTLLLAACSPHDTTPGPMVQKDSDWPVHSGDMTGSRYSVLGQITPENVAGLEVAWTYSSGEMKRRTPQQFQRSKDGNIPIKIGNRLLVCSPFNRIASIDPATGKEQWSFDPKVDLDLGKTDTVACRGVTYWRDPVAQANAPCAERVISNTTDHRLLAVDLHTGRLCQGFGQGGIVQIAPDKPLLHKLEMTFFMPPVVKSDTIIIGSSIEDDVRTDAPSGKIRAFDVRTGKPKWEWDPVPRSPSDPAFATWGPNRKTIPNGGANAWGFITADPTRDVVYIPTTNPSADAYGGDRPGDNRHTESIVAVQASTGKLIWSYQIVHHDLWDFDNAPQPLLADLPINGKIVPALIQNTKQGLIFVLNRETGKPVFRVDEVPVPKGDIPGEWYSPTQPIPRFPALRPLTITEDQAWGITPWDKSECKSLIRKYRKGPLYTPTSREGTIVPWWGGGVEWPGPAYDPRSHVMVVNSNRIFGVYKLIDIKGATRQRGVFGTFPMAGTPYALQKTNLVSSSGVPCSPPPWNGLTAIDMTTGKKLWDVPLGSIERNVPGKPRINMNWWGMPGVGGPVITAGGVIFIAGTIDQRIRAFSLKTGEELWNTVLPADAQTTPITYAANGRQFVVISAGGSGQLKNARGDYVVAYALPHKQ